MVIAPPVRQCSGSRHKQPGNSQSWYAWWGMAEARVLQRTDLTDRKKTEISHILLRAQIGRSEDIRGRYGIAHGANDDEPFAGIRYRQNL